MSDAEIETQREHCSTNLLSHGIILPALIVALLDHCLQLFFDAARCKGDTALTTFRWVDSDPRPAAMFDGQHECVSWVELFEWAEERHVNKSEMMSLKNPIYNGSLAV